MPDNVILFDINETVLNLNGLEPKFKLYLGDDSHLKTWFAMLLHSSTVCVATKVETDFKSLASAALYSLSSQLNKPLSSEACSDILNTFGSLPAHSDIKPALTKLRNANFKLVAFSNSSLTLLSSQLKNAQLHEYFDDAISLESVGTFKPSEKSYNFAVSKLNVPASQIRLVAAHDWDTHGALSAGLNAAFINRQGAIYNPLYEMPSITGSTMTEVANKIIGEQSRQ